MTKNQARMLALRHHKNEPLPRGITCRVIAQSESGLLVYAVTSRDESTTVIVHPDTATRYGLRVLSQMIRADEVTVGTHLAGGVVTKASHTSDLVVLTWGGIETHYGPEQTLVLALA